jgi:hypothetical protein
MPEPIDYAGLIEKLLEDRADIDRMVAWATRKLKEETGELPVTASQPQPNAKPINPIRYGSLAPDTFFRMTVPDAIKKYLNIAKRPKTAKDITAALDSGGLTHQAKNLYATVYPTLMRMEGNNDVARVGKGEWGLAEWYPGSRKGNQEEKTESKD